MTNSLGWYIHHHGTGHLTRFLAIRPYLTSAVVVFSSLTPPEPLPERTCWVQLPMDNDGEPTSFLSPQSDGLLHWAPLGHPGYRDRMSLIAAGVAEHRCAGIVVDVSIEVTLMARLLGLPTAILAVPGNRTDLPHQLAFRAATSIVASWPESMKVPAGLEPWLTKVHFVGGISRFDGRNKWRARVPGEVVVLGGGGGSDITAADISAAAAATPHLRWTGIGIASAHTWVADPWPLLCAAQTVVSLGGQGAVADLAAVGASAIILPQQRPFDEQIATATALSRHGLAIAAPKWPTASQWPDLMAAAEALEPQWSRWQVAGAAARAADVLDELVGSR